MTSLTWRPVQVALLHGSGVPITVPAPERFAIQELISASGRSLKIGDVAEREKNVAKALTLMEALIYTRRTSDLAEAYDAARNRGEAWGVGIAKGIDVIRDRERLSKVIENLNKALAKVGSEPVLVN